MASGNPGYMPPAESVEWLTPPELYEYLDRRYHFDDFDPAPYPRPPGFDGLKISWRGSVYVNPPYGLQLRAWVQKAYESSSRGEADVVMLLPSRTDTKWFHDYAVRGVVQFILGRVRYVRPDGSSEPAPFPSLLLIFSPTLEPRMEVVRVPGAGSSVVRKPKPAHRRD